MKNSTVRLACLGHEKTNHVALLMDMGRTTSELLKLEA